MRSKFLAVAVAGVVASSWAGVSNAALTYRTVALTGNVFPDYSGSTSPATSAGQSWGVTTANTNAFANAVLNTAGQIVFQGSLIGTGVTSNNNDRGLWSEGSGSLKLLARRADPAFTTSGIPSAGGVNFGLNMLGPNINSAGDVVFLSTLTGTGIVTTGTSSNNNAQFTSIGGVTRMTVQLNDPVSINGSSAAIRGLGGLPVLNSSGTYAFVATLAPSVSAANAIYTYTPSGLNKVVAFGDSAPGTDLGSGLATFGTTSSYGAPVINASGTVAFLATLTTGAAGVTSGVNDRGIWIASPGGSPELLVRAGNAAPGTGGATFSTTISNTPGFNSSGVVAFSASLTTGGAITSANNAGIWRGSSSSNLALVVQKGSQVADLTSGTLYNALNASMISKSGLVAFTTSLTGTGVTTANDTALILETPSGLTTFAREGSTAPGGKLFGNFSSASYFALNAEGHIAFLSSLTDTLGGSSTANGLFAQDFDGSLLLIAQTGLPFEVAPGVFKTPSSITFNNVSVSFSGGDDGRASAWNDSHQIAFTLLFSDGSSGVFTSSIPEPTTSLVLAGLGLPLLGRRRSR